MYRVLNWKPDKCAICSAVNVSLVKDHHHETGVIRGGLCYPCNQHIGFMERVAGKVPTPRYLSWFTRYQAQILAHLNCNIGQWPKALTVSHKLNESRESAS